MKQATVFFLVLTLAFSGFSQQNEPSPTFTKQDYMHKSKKQKTVAWVLLGGGAASVLTGIIIPKGDVVREGAWGNDYENDGIKSTFGVTGFLCMIGSIPFFIASKKNYKRAMSVSFKNEVTPQLVKSSFVYRSIPAFNLKISL
jgi:hypothetical protein